MRHWDDILLRSVLSGQNTTGKLKSAQLKESTFVVEMRTKKLMREKRQVSDSTFTDINTLCQAVIISSHSCRYLPGEDKAFCLIKT